MIVIVVIIVMYVYSGRQSKERNSLPEDKTA